MTLFETINDLVSSGCNVSFRKPCDCEGIEIVISCDNRFYKIVMPYYEIENYKGEEDTMISMALGYGKDEIKRQSVCPLKEDKDESKSDTK